MSGPKSGLLAGREADLFLRDGSSTGVKTMNETPACVSGRGFFRQTGTLLLLAFLARRSGKRLFLVGDLC